MNITVEQALDAVRNVLQRAYNSAEPVCCGRAGTECCGSPEPEWSEYDEQIMSDLQPVEEYLSQALTAPSVPDEAIRKNAPCELDISEQLAWAEGWNACRESMLTAAPAPADPLPQEQTNE